ncbi:MAG: hypothetical protein IPF79_04625 [Ignavibacteria bacterium]|nr:hypothetical protein [Ignavibacteria bacterium]
MDIDNRYDASCFRGDDFALTIEFDEAITGRTYAGKVVNGSTGADIATMSISIDTVNKIVVASLTEAETLLATAGKHSYYVTETNAGFTETIIYGSLYIRDRKTL